MSSIRELFQLIVVRVCRTLCSNAMRCEYKQQYRFVQYHLMPESNSSCHDVDAVARDAFGCGGLSTFYEPKGINQTCWWTCWLNENTFLFFMHINKRRGGEKEERGRKGEGEERGRRRRERSEACWLHVKRKQNKASKSKRFILFYAEDKGVVKGEEGRGVQREGGGGGAAANRSCARATKRKT